MHHSRVKSLMVVGVILAISAGATALACSAQEEQAAQAERNPRYAPVYISVTSAEDPETRGTAYTVRVFPWKVAVASDRLGVDWICDISGIIEDCEIEFAGPSATHFVDAGAEVTPEEKKITKNVNPELIEREWGDNENKHSIAGAYNIRITLDDGTVLNIDPDHVIDPRRGG